MWTDKNECFSLRFCTKVDQCERICSMQQIGAARTGPKDALQLFLLQGFVQR